MTDEIAFSQRWTHTAGWCACLACVWLLGITTWTWLDNRGQPWLGWALERYGIPPLVLLVASLLAWRGRGRLKRVGWGLFGLVGLLLTVHVLHEFLDRWVTGS